MHNLLQWPRMSHIFMFGVFHSFSLSIPFQLRNILFFLVDSFQKKEKTKFCPIQPSWKKGTEPSRQYVCALKKHIETNEKTRWQL